MLAGFRFECFPEQKSIGILSLTVFLRTGILSSECYRGRLRRSQVSTININPDLATFTKLHKARWINNTPQQFRLCKNKSVISRDKQNDNNHL